MNTITQNAPAKTPLNFDAFEKKVQIEAAHLEYFNRLPKDVARKEAEKYISSKFELVRKTA